MTPLVNVNCVVAHRGPPRPRNLPRSPWRRLNPARIARLLMAAAGLVACAHAQHASAQDAGPLVAPPNFARYRLAVQQELGDVLPLDLSGSGRLDLVLLELDRSRRDAPARLELYRQSETGFAAAPAAAAELPPALTLLGAGRFVQGPGLALLTPAGVSLWIWNGERFQPRPELTLAVESVFPVAGGEPRTTPEWVLDLDGDGLSELLVPRADGFALVRQDAQGRLLPPTLLHIAPQGQVVNFFRRRLAAYDLPTLRSINPAAVAQPAPAPGPAGGPAPGSAGGSASGQHPARRWRDLIAFNDGIVAHFPLAALGTGDPAPRELAPDLLQDLQPPKPFDPQAPYDPPLQFISAEDLNADGLPDLVFSKSSSGESEINAKTRVLIYLGRKEAGALRYGAEPDQAFDLHGFTLPFLLDLNHDGRVDLVLVNVEVTFWNTVTALLSRSVNAEAAFYLMPEEGRYRRKPDAAGHFSVKFTLGRASHQPIVTFGDLNGDGLPDLLLAGEQNRLGVHWGRAGGFWNDQPDEVERELLPIRADRVRVLDLDHDGRDDVLLLYNRDDIRQMPEVNHTFTVLLSRFERPPRP